MTKIKKEKKKKKEMKKKLSEIVNENEIMKSKKAEKCADLRKLSLSFKDFFLRGEKFSLQVYAYLSGCASMFYVLGKLLLAHLKHMMRFVGAIPRVSQSALFLTLPYFSLLFLTLLFFTFSHDFDKHGTDGGRT